jgi:FkbM family methyltransferase
VSYSRKHAIVSWVSRSFFDRLTYTVRNGLNKGLRRRGGLGWLPMEHPTPETLFWKALDLKDKVVYDVGAFHGLLTMFFARQARLVVAWEPNSRNRQRLNQNIHLNAFGNVVVRSYGLSNRAALADMAIDPLAPGTASVAAGMAAGSEHETIELRTLDQETLDREEALAAPDLIKIDVEGSELEVLEGAERTLASRPALFLEMHGRDAEDKRRRVTAIVEHLWKIGYRDILHVESRSRITPENALVAAQGHLYARGGGA